MNKFKTSDLNLAAFLRVKKIKLEEVIPSEDPRRAIFIFDATDVPIEKFITDFYNNAQVSAIELIRELDNLKSMARNLIKVT